MSKILKNLGKVALTIPLIIILSILVIIDLIQIDALLEHEIPFLLYPITAVLYFVIIWILSKIVKSDLSDLADSDSFDGD